MPHTPGPWLVHDRWYIGTEGGGTHAEVKCCVAVPADAEDQHEANARLIAAAPDLLAACKTLRDRLLAFVGAVADVTDCSEDVKAVQSAEAAILKAQPK